MGANLLSLSSAMVRRIPFPWGREIHGLLPLPITKMLENHVANLLPFASFTWTTSKELGCLSRFVITPILCRLAPPVTMHRLPVSNLMKSVILPVSKSIWMVSFTPQNIGGDQGNGWYEHHGLPDEEFLLSPQISFLLCTIYTRNTQGLATSVQLTCTMLQSTMTVLSPP